MKTITLLLLATTVASSRVLELGDRFLEIHKDGIWLVKFYAPWCGHCKKLEPIYNHVAQALHDTPIRVGRVDCTRFPNVGAEFHVQGFPTILMIKHQSTTIFNGERNAQEITQFAKRMSRDSISNSVSMEKDGFHYIGEKGGQLWEEFLQNSLIFQSSIDFYKTDLDMPPGVYHSPSLKKETTPTLLTHFINTNRFGNFPKITATNFQNMLLTKKLVAMVLVEDEEGEELRDLIEMFSKEKGEEFFNFQFGWSSSVGWVNSIALGVLGGGDLFVYNSNTSEFCFFKRGEGVGVEVGVVREWLGRVKEGGGGVETHGGNTLSWRLYRSYYGTRTQLSLMFHGNPILTLLLFGLPSAFLSLICYSICCADILEDEHEKNE